MLIDTVAWVRVEDGRVLCARPRGKDVFYVPGGKREPGESDVDVLLREAEEELTVRLDAASARHLGTYEAEVPESPGTRVRMSCWTAEHSGDIAPSSEIEEIAWFTLADRAEVPPVDRLLFDELARWGLLD
ncbi:putative MutT-family protein [Streptomyces sp. Tu6071]|uniref:NUDIX hydrolase n=1 Tax=Streptomyces sp. Tu6071 TaxID=355249 RepID=UPI00020E565F|nr:NUDIX domain-containing protein [Streptomyces sp. Tu6071]EGJ74956.1 putative MutT-family protein [Streptomyces sp. Tu6071]